MVESESTALINSLCLDLINSVKTHCAALKNDETLSDTDGSIDDITRVETSCDLLTNSLTDISTAKFPDTENISSASISKLKHDLRTPLNAIIGYTELYSERLDELQKVGQKIHCTEILSAANSLLEHTESLCDLLINGEPNQTKETAVTGADISTHLQRISERNEASSNIGRVLIVDDIEENRDLLSRYLKPVGHEVSLASTGIMALDMVAQAQFDIILLDIIMPDMNGLEVLEALKADDQHRQIPIIVISGLSQIDAVASCIAAGAEDYLTKPFNQVLLKARISSCLQKKKWADKERSYLKEIETEKNRSDAILDAILPMPIIQRLKSSNDPIADRIENVSILFADVVGFTPAAETMSPEKLLKRLDVMFSGFDELTHQYGIEKIKTIGDAYMAACGAPLAVPDSTDRILDFAIAILNLMQQIELSADAFKLRIGIHSGPVIAGLVGRRRYVYDLWGETVNLASRLESNGIVNKICVSDTIVKSASSRFEFQSRGLIELKGIGPTHASILIPPKL